LAGSPIYSEFKVQALSLLEGADTTSRFYKASPLIFKLFEMGGEYERRKQELARHADGDYADWLEDI
jgi:hypothetical protein